MVNSILDIDKRIANGFMWNNNNLLLVIIFNENPSHNENILQASNKKLIKTEIESDSETWALQAIEAIDNGNFIKFSESKLNEILKANPKIPTYIFSQNNTIAVLNMDEKELIKKKQSDMNTNNYYKVNEAGKYELYFDISTYKSMPEADKGDLKRYFLWSNAKKAWISKSKEGYWAKKIAEKTGLAFEGKDKAMTFQEEIEKKKANAEHRSESYEYKAEKATKTAESLQAEFNRLRKDWSWLTQPIISGHKGSQAFGRSKQRVLDKYERGYKEYDKAAYYETRKQIAEDTLKDAKLKDVKYVENRIKEAEKTVRIQTENIEIYNKNLVKEGLSDEQITKLNEGLERSIDRLKYGYDKLAYYQVALEDLLNKNQGGDIKVFNKELAKELAQYIKTYFKGAHNLKVSVSTSSSFITMQYRPEIPNDIRFSIASFEYPDNDWNIEKDTDVSIGNINKTYITLRPKDWYKYLKTVDWDFGKQGESEQTKKINDKSTIDNEISKESTEHLSTFEKIQEGEITTPEKLGESIETDHVNKSNDTPSTESRQRFSPVKEIDRKEIITMPELFQGRQHAYSEESVNKIVSEGFDKTNDPIVVWWNPEKSKYVVLSGHSRWEASSRLYLAGDLSLSTMPVKEFLGTIEEAINYAVLESNRASTQEGIISDIKAVHRMLNEGFNKKEMIKFIRPESYLDKIITFTYLNPNGKFIEYLSQPSNVSFPYLERNASWVGSLRRMYKEKLTDFHETEIFDYIYKGSKKALELKKDAFFNMIQSKIDKLDFDPNKPLNLSNIVSTSALTKPGYEKIKEIESEIQSLQTEMIKKTDLISRASREGKDELVEKFKMETRGLEQKIITLKNRVYDLKQQIGALEKTVSNDLFSMFSEPEQKKIKSEVITYPQEEIKEAEKEAVMEAKEEADECFMKLDKNEALSGMSSLEAGQMVNFYGINYEIEAIKSNVVTFKKSIPILGGYIVDYSTIIKLFHSGHLKYANYDNTSESDRVKFDLMITNTQLCSVKEQRYQDLYNVGKKSVNEIVKLSELNKSLALEVESYQSKLSQIDDEKSEKERMESEALQVEKEKARTIQEYEDIISIYSELIKETKNKTEKQEYTDIVEIYTELLTDLK
jgi:BMFP domain-containing protein YqiC